MARFTKTDESIKTDVVKTIDEITHGAYEAYGRLDRDREVTVDGVEHTVHDTITVLRLKTTDSYILKKKLRAELRKEGIFCNGRGLIRLDDLHAMKIPPEGDIVTAMWVSETHGCPMPIISVAVLCEEEARIIHE